MRHRNIIISDGEATKEEIGLMNIMLKYHHISVYMENGVMIARSSVGNSVNFVIDSVGEAYITLIHAGHKNDKNNKEGI